MELATGESLSFEGEIRVDRFQNHQEGEIAGRIEKSWTETHVAWVEDVKHRQPTK